jgi:multidrug efflux pump subunit AcrA (membrane-fusion protein)
MARADLTLARLQLERAEHAAGYLAQEAIDIARARHQRAAAEVESLQAELQIVEVNLAKHRLVAPFDGVLTGQTPLPGQQVTASQTVAILVSGAMRIRAEATPEELSALHDGTGSMRLLEAGSDAPPAVRLIAAGPVADELTGLAIVHLEAPATLKVTPGELLDLGFYQEAAYVDPRAVRTDEAGQFLLLVDGGRIHRSDLDDVRRLRPEAAEAVLFGPDGLATGDRVRPLPRATDQ